MHRFALLALALLVLAACDDSSTATDSGPAPTVDAGPQLDVCGGYRLACDKRTEVVCLAISVDDCYAECPEVEPTVLGGCEQPFVDWVNCVEAAPSDSDALCPGMDETVGSCSATFIALYECQRDRS